MSLLLLEVLLINPQFMAGQLAAAGCLKLIPSLLEDEPTASSFPCWGSRTSQAVFVLRTASTLNYRISSALGDYASAASNTVILLCFAQLATAAGGVRLRNLLIAALRLVTCLCQLASAFMAPNEVLHISSAAHLLGSRRLVAQVYYAWRATVVARVRGALKARNEIASSTTMSATRADGHRRRKTGWQDWS